MSIQSTQPAAFTVDDMTVLGTLADQLAVAIENARYVAETSFRAENERILNQIAAQLSRSLDLQTILQTAVEEIRHIPKIREVAIHVGELTSVPISQDVEDFLTESQHGLRIITPDPKN